MEECANLFLLFLIILLAGCLGAYFKKRAANVPTFFLILLGISPLGAIFPYIIFSILEICRGALGSGVTCDLPIGSGYLESVAMWNEVSMFLMGAGIIWTAAGFTIWGLILIRTLNLIFSIFKGNNSIPEQATETDTPNEK